MAVRKVTVKNFPHPINMRTNSFDATEHFDDQHAEKYDRRIRLFCPSYDALHALMAPLLEQLHEQSTLLSAGSGTGAEIINLGARHPSWRFVGVDVSQDMLNACRQRLEGSGISSRVALQNARIQDYQSSEQFDAATSVFVAHFIKERDEKLAYFRAIASRLKPGGIFVLADLFGDKGSKTFDFLRKAWMLSYASHGVSPEELVKDQAHIERDVSFIPEGELATLLIEAGFLPPVRFYQTFLFGGWVTARAG